MNLLKEIAIFYLLVPLAALTVIVFLSPGAILSDVHIIDQNGIIALVLELGGFILWCLGVAAVIQYFNRRSHPTRSKPEGYVGKFRRPDGEIVHVARLKDGKLTVASEPAEPGEPSRFLGTIDGRELMSWHKLATTPDGDRH